MAGKKFEPVFGKPGDDPSSLVNIGMLKAQIDGIIKWARLMDARVKQLENVLVNADVALTSMSVSLEATVNLLISGTEFNEDTFAEMKSLIEDQLKELEKSRTPDGSGLLLPGKDF